MDLRARTPSFSLAVDATPERPQGPETGDHDPAMTVA